LETEIIDFLYKKMIKSINTKVIWGNVHSLFQNLLKCSALVLIDDSCAKLKNFKFLANLKRKKQLNLVFVNITEEPTYRYLEEIFQLVKKKRPDLIVGIGGGSLLDYTKGISILFNNKLPALSYRGSDLVKTPGIPCILVPSLAGSGAEVTSTASFTDSNANIKLGINGKFVSASMVFYDPKIYQNAPEALKIKGIWDSLVHLIEAVTSKTANLLSLNLAQEALRDLVKAANVKNNSILKSKLNLKGSAKAAFAMMVAGGGISSGLSYPLGIYSKIPHAEAGGRILPNVIEAHIKKGYFAGYLFLLQAFTKKIPSSKKQGAKRFLKNLKTVFYNNVKTNQSRYEIDRQKGKFLVSEFLKTRKQNYQNDPVSFSEKEILRILMRSF